MDVRFAIVIENVRAMCAAKDNDPRPRLGHVVEQIDLKKGMMVEVQQLSDKYATVRVHDYYQKNALFERNLFLVKASALYEVAIDVWPYVVAINDPVMRLNFARDRYFIDYVMSLDVGSFATVHGIYFMMSSINQSLSFLPEREPQNRILDYECVVRYMGPVEEIGPGCVFGLELLVNFNKLRQLLISQHPPNIAAFSSFQTFLFSAW